MNDIEKYISLLLHQNYAYIVACCSIGSELKPQWSYKQLQNSQIVQHQLPRDEAESIRREQLLYHGSCPKIW